eukprot:1170254-Amphidinium_carterae.1
MKDLDKAGRALPENAKGIILLRDAALSVRQFWTQGSFDLGIVHDALKKLGRPTTTIGEEASTTVEHYEEESNFCLHNWDEEAPWMDNSCTAEQRLWVDEEEYE